MSKCDHHIITWGGLGDVVLLTPALREIKRSNPGARVIVDAGAPEHYEILRHNPNIDRLALRSRLFKRSLDFLSKIGCFPKRYVIPNYGKYAPSVWTPPSHAAKIIGEILGVTVSDVCPEIFLTAEEDLRAESMLAPLHWPVAIQITSSRESKDWPREYWEKLISANPQYDFVQLGACIGPKLKGTVDLPKSDLRMELALLKHCKAFLGGDSFFAHAASAFRIPAVVLFGASGSSTWGYTSNINLSSGMRCSPCIDRLTFNKCPYDVKCMKMIQVEQVQQALIETLGLAKSSFQQEPRSVQ